MKENPYQSPLSADDAEFAPRSKDSRHVYKPLNVLLMWNRNLAIVAIIGSTLFLVQDVAESTTSLGDLISGDDEPLTMYEWVTGAIAVGLLICTTVWNIIFLMATYRLSANAHALSDFPPSYSPAFAVGSYFIPIVNLIRPYQVMKQCYESCSAKTGLLLIAWWVCHIISWVLGAISMRVLISSELESVPSRAESMLGFSTAIDLFDQPFYVALAILSHVVLSRLASQQAKLAAEHIHASMNAINPQ